MTAQLRNGLWLAFAALGLFTVAALLYTEMYGAAVSADLMDQYRALDAQLSDRAQWAKKIFGWGEAGCFVLVCNLFWRLSKPSVLLRVAHGYMFALAMMNLGDALFGNYIESFELVWLEYRWAKALAVLALLEIIFAYRRGKHP